MGGLCSRSANDEKVLAQTDEHLDSNTSNKNGQSSMPGSELTSAPQRVENLQETAGVRDGGTNGGTSLDEFYDGIPRFTDSLTHKSRSVRSRQAAVAKVGPSLLISVCFGLLLSVSEYRTFSL